MGTSYKVLKPWFGKGGDRTLEQQLTGLDELLDHVPGKSVLDVGCAEGLISHHLIDNGAAAVHGLEVRADFVDEANRLRGDRACSFDVADANEYKPKREYDIVLMLAVLHKLKNPSDACKKFAKAARDLVVLRLPPKEAPFIIDERSGSKPFDIAKAMEDSGFRLGAHGRIGPFNEWMGYYTRVK